MPRKKSAESPAPSETPPAQNNAGGSAYRARAGKVGIMLSVTPDERDILKAGAWNAGVSMARFALDAALAAVPAPVLAALRKLKKSGK